MVFENNPYESPKYLQSSSTYNFKADFMILVKFSCLASDWKENILRTRLIHCIAIENKSYEKLNSVKISSYCFHDNSLKPTNEFNKILTSLMGRKGNKVNTFIILRKQSL